MEDNQFLPNKYKGQEYNTCLTINTDASHCGQTLAGGYAFWAVCDKFVYKKGDILKDTSKNSTEAETKAIANALSLILKRDDLPKLNFIIINTDSKNSITNINGRKNPIAKTAAEYLDRLVVATSAQNIELRHVKAHTGAKNARSKVNEWCDREAKKFMILRRNQIKTQKI